MRIQQQSVPTDNPEQYARELPAAVFDEDDCPTHEVPTMGIVTATEHLALEAVEITEWLAEPLTVWDVLRWGVRLVAAIARRI